MRTRALARRRAGGEELATGDRRRLDAHLAGCGRCREHVVRLPATVGGGNPDPPRANVSRVEAGTTSQEQGRSDVDAMGQDKKRSVVGQGYGPTRGRQFLYYGIFIAVLVAIYFGGKIAVDELDKAPKSNADQAPWSQKAAPQEAPRQFQ